MIIETERLIITKFNIEMAQVVHENSLDEDNRRFLPDEVFETVDEARETIEFLMSQYDSEDGPLVYPIITKDGNNIGYVQLVPIEEGWEIGYHIAKKYTGNGYATEAVMAFLPYIAKRKALQVIWGVCLKENLASIKVMEKCGFEIVFMGEGDYQGEKNEIVKSIFYSVMSKYDPLWKWIAENGQDNFKISYAQIEDILGFQIDHSFLKFKKELLDYGFQVGKISMKEETVTFEKLKL